MQGYVHIDEALKLAATRTCEEISGLLAEQASAPGGADRSPRRRRMQIFRC
jgi:hypothetical protein